MPIQITVTEEFDKTRIDAFLSTASQGELSRSAVQNLCEAGLVLYNGVAAAKNLKVKTGGIVEYELPEPVKLDAFPENIPIEIVYEDEHLLILDKPSGMLSQKSKPEDISLNEVGCYMIEQRVGALQGFRPGVCNRLDRNTSGLVVAGKSLIGLQKMGELFKERILKKLKSTGFN